MCSYEENMKQITTQTNINQFLQTLSESTQATIQGGSAARDTPQDSISFNYMRVQTD